MSLRLVPVRITALFLLPILSACGTSAQETAAASGPVATAPAPLPCEGCGRRAGEGTPPCLEARLAVEAVKGEPATPLSEAEKDALLAALDDEYKAFALYDGVMQDFGEIRPFSHIREAERSHIDSLLALCARYGVVAPESTWAERAPHFAGVAEACAASRQAEIDNDALYRRLLPSVEHAEMVTVFEALARASREHHLPAFERCMSGGGPGAGKGCGQGAGAGCGQGPGPGAGRGAGRGCGQGRGGGGGRRRRGAGGR